MGTDPTQRLELWSGVECTVNRVHDQYFDQIERTGHASRIDDLDLFAELGIGTLRYPILWERTSNDRGDVFDWSWADERLKRFQLLGLRPIVGLVHHGSGPRGTNLIDPGFAEGLARYGRELARRYPWIEDFTPVNEPLTTARFSGLYGHWYPHGHDELKFARALIQQCRAVVLTMRAIREVTPHARLIQTEDFGKTHSTPQLSYQAEFENERRWVTWDLLSGRVDKRHPMWAYLRWAGIYDFELEWFLENNCEPDILGINYYLTSERFLDHRVGLYPPNVIGGNGRDTYADVEAVRVLAAGIAGMEDLLEEVGQRYQRPIAITEVHNGCTREEQARWLLDIWTAAQRVKERNGNVQAVTAWALLGAFDWSSLVTRDAGCYEAGIFDIRAPRPRRTALAGMLSQLARGEIPNHPLLEAPGWWKRPERLLFGISYPDDRTPEVCSISAHPLFVAAHPLLITGNTTELSCAYARICEVRGIPYRLLTRDELDVANSDSVSEAILRYHPWAVVNTAGYGRFQDRDHCFIENAIAPAILAQVCATRGIRLMTLSSDLVFDGKACEPYVESDLVSPLNTIGKSQAEGERRVLEVYPEALVIRTSSLFGPYDDSNFVTRTLLCLADSQQVRASADIMSPTYVPDLIDAALDLLIDGETGLWHLANGGAVSEMELAKRLARLTGFDDALVVPWPAQGWIARRPRYSPLRSERAEIMPRLDDALSRYLQECRVDWRAQRLAVG